MHKQNGTISTFELESPFSLLSGNNVHTTNEVGQYTKLHLSRQETEVCRLI